MQYLAFLILAPVALTISLGVLVSVARKGRLPETPSLVALMVAVAGWLILNSLEILSGSPEATRFWAKATYLFIGATPTAWLAFTVQYTGTRRRRGLLVVAASMLVPVGTLLLLWSRRYEYLVWQSYGFSPVLGFLTMQVTHGPWFYAHVVNAYASVVLGSTLIAINRTKLQRLYREQSWWLLAGALTPVLVNVIYVFGLVPGLTKDFTPIGFALSGLAFSLGIDRYLLFDVQPIARTTLVESMRDAVITLDSQSRVLDLNPAALDLLPRIGATSTLDEAIGAPASELLRGWPALERCTKAGSVEDADLVLADEPERHYACTATELYSRRQRRIGRLIVLRDITDRKHAEVALRRQMEELRISNEQLDAFAHTVAHNLKGPLSNMTGFVEMLEFYLDRLSTEEVQQSLDSLNAAGRQMTRIIDSMLLLAQVHRQEDLTLEPLNMASAVVEALQCIDHLIANHEARVSVPEAWPTVFGYGPWITQVWVNYLMNAVRYGGDPPHITLGHDREAPTAAAMNGGAQAARFWVRDNGHGLTEEQMATLFSPFTRFDDVTSEGHGLGLSIVHRIVDRLGGQVGVESKVGVGSTFWFTLPLAQPPLTPRS